MNNKITWAVVGLLAIITVTGVTAAPQQVQGLNAVVLETGTDQTIQYKFPIASDDPGTYTYNATIDATGPVIFSDVETTLGGVREDGFITFRLEITGATAEYDTFVNAYDGADNGTASCTVTVDTGVIYDYDSCGTMDPTYQNHHCMTLDEPYFGFSYSENVGVRPALEELNFEVNGDASAYGGLNLGGDSVEYRYDFEVSAAVDGSVSKILMFYSAVDLEASASSVGDGAVTVKTAFTVPRTGAFASGVGVALEESGSNYNAKFFYNDAGTTFLLDERELSDGVTANSGTMGAMIFSEYLSVFNFTLGNEVSIFSTDDITDFDNFHSFWLVEYGGTGFFATQSRHTTDQASNCLQTLSAAQGGAVAVAGAPSAVTAYESFDGQGGPISDPTYPFVDMEAASERIEITPEAFGYIMSVISLMMLAFVGFITARRNGILVGVLLLVPFMTQLGNIPQWLPVLIYLLSVAYGILKNGKTNGGITDA